MKNLRRILREEEGSAVVEFVALAIPLFIPLFIYLNQYSVHSDKEANLRTLGREMARAFVTRENDSVANDVAYEVFVKGANVLGYGRDLAAGTLNYNYACKNVPCISPDNQITITLADAESNIEVKAVEYVSPWA